MFSDTSFIKNLFGKDCVGPSPVDRGRKATKLSVVCDEIGVVHSLTFHPGNKNDSRILGHTLRQRHPSYWEGKTLSADKGYDTDKCRGWVRENGMLDAIMRKVTTKIAYPLAPTPRRTIVENVFAWIDTSRRLIMRYEKQIAVYRSFTYLALLPIVGRRVMAWV